MIPRITQFGYQTRIVAWRISCKNINANDQYFRQSAIFTILWVNVGNVGWINLHRFLNFLWKNVCRFHTFQLGVSSVQFVFYRSYFVPIFSCVQAHEPQLSSKWQASPIQSISRLEHLLHHRGCESWCSLPWCWNRRGHLLLSTKALKTSQWEWTNRKLTEKLLAKKIFSCTKILVCLNFVLFWSMRINKVWKWYRHSFHFIV